jgi:hypothetical protein
MGLFSNIFRLSSTIEKQLEEIYVPIFKGMGMLLSQAEANFHELLKLAKKESQKEGTSSLPQNYGDILLEKESTDDKIKVMLAKKRKEGVRNEDLKWWWNMHDLERRMMLKVSEWTALALFIKLREEDGLNEREAGKIVMKSHPMFGDPDDTTHTTGEDRPLPYELNNRIDIYINKMSQTDPEQFKRDIKEASTLNALIRKEIKKGNI